MSQSSWRIYAGEQAALVDLLDSALRAVLAAGTLDQARGIAHAGLCREEYHGHEVDVVEGTPDDSPL